MKKKILSLVGLAMAATMLVGCGETTSTSTPDAASSPDGVPVTKYTVAFEVDGQRYATVRVESGKTITETITNPYKEGYDFDGWYEGSTKVNLATYVVTKNVTFVAKFTEAQEDDTLSVTDVKEDGKDYYLVFGWWEAVGTKSDGTEAQPTSGMTPSTVRLFYRNLINYLTITGATEADIENIQCRDYSTPEVAQMGEKVNADGDVDLLIGVGNNINSTAGVSLLNGNDSKFSTVMGALDKIRYVANPASTSELGTRVFDWLKATDAGKKAFIAELTKEEIEASLVPESIKLTVNVHGDTTVTTVLEDKDTAVTMPTITVPEGQLFKGFAIAEGGEVVLKVAKDATLKYDDLKDLVAEGADSIDLYPVFEDEPVVEDDLVVYVQVNGSYLTAPEAALLEARFQATLTDEKVRFEVKDEAADAFKATIEAAEACDVIVGGNKPVGSLPKAEGTEVGNAGAKHFVSTNRKVIISNSCVSDHLTLAQKFYDFVVAEADVFEVHSTYWRKNGDWVTDTEMAAFESAIQANVEAYMGVEAGKLEEVYNIKLSSYDAQKTKVAELGEETRALREGKGTDLIIGCGANVNATEGTTAGMTIVEKKALNVAASSRYVALVHENAITRNIYDNVFTVAE
jgi:uncharacterized repeat protein (TIGR02543 family)